MVVSVSGNKDSFVSFTACAWLVHGYVLVRSGLGYFVVQCIFLCT